MKNIKAPFNFVPLGNKVFFPSWADSISHDIPFEDGLSGCINIELTANTPIFIKNGVDKNDYSFCHTDDGRYFIPSTSIKGMIRSVFEIMTEGKLGKGRVQNQSFGLRDLSNSTIGQYYREKIKPENIHCGWLSCTQCEQYKLDDCGLPWRISIDALDGRWGTQLGDFIRQQENFKSDENRTALKKYQMIVVDTLQGTFSPDYELRQNLKVGNRLFVKFDSCGEKGTVVLTGQPGARKVSNIKTQSGNYKQEGKFFEFVFPDKIEKKSISIDELVIKEFFSIHQNSPDFENFRKNQLNNGEPIPVFFSYNSDGTIESIGLSYMFKYPAYSQIYDAMDSSFLSDAMDMADCVFGYSSSSNSLKGRVCFSHAFAPNNSQLLDPCSIVLSKPHPSFYPLYLGNGQTWNNEKITIAGRKRYPTRLKISNGTTGTEEMNRTMRPLPKGTTFTGKIIYHNLKEVELGALLSALTFHNQADCHHNIGMAKPLGYGNVSLKIVDMKQDDISNYLAKFSETMSAFDSRWMESIHELFVMAKGIPEGRENEFSYMEMDVRNNNEFKKAKESYANGEQLGYFSQILNNNVPQSKFLGTEFAKSQRKNAEREMQMKQERLEKFEQCKGLASEKMKFEDYKEALSLLIEAKKYALDYSEINILEEKCRQELDKLRKEEMLRIQELEEKKNQQRKEQRVDSGLAFLEQKNEAGKFFVNDFENAKKRIDGWLKKDINQQSVPEQFHEDLYRNLVRILQNSNNRDRKIWKDFNGKYWQKITCWVGPDLSSQWFGEFQKQI